MAVKILLLQNMLYVPSFGGANKLTRLLMEALACRGHDCSVVAPVTGSFGPRNAEEFATMLEGRNTEFVWSQPERFQFRCGGVDALVVSAGRLRDAAVERIRTFKPDVILVAAEDPGQMLLATACEISPFNLVYLVQTPWNLPFGHASMAPSENATELIKRTSRVVTISHFLKDYMLRWGGLNSIVFHFPVFGDGPFPYSARFGRGSVTLINPSKIKGLTLFLELARRMPDVSFAAVPTWATTAEDLHALRQAANVILLEPEENIDSILSKTSVLLVPSLWYEAFGFITVDAMLRGIPVLASNIGGLVEAKLGVDYLLPVRPIESYLSRFDDRCCPVPIIPAQDVGAWELPLRKLLSCSSHYEDLSQASRTAALAFVAPINLESFEKLLSEVVTESQVDARRRLITRSQPKSVVAPKELSTEKRALLALSALKRRNVLPQ